MAGMMKNMALLATTILLASVLTIGKPLPLPNRLSARTAFVAKSKQENYTEKSLYEYIDGGADVYIEAGAKEASARS
jgi:hypothetical protein